jgi:hypothetical protein
MKDSKYFRQLVALASAVVPCATLSANAAITLTLQDATSRAEAGFQAVVPGGTLNANELIGIYKFTSSGLSTDPTLWSTCLSPSGVLDWNPHTYVSESFTAGSPGHNPAAWSTVGAPDSGIQNAQFLWRMFSPAVIASGNADQGAGLVMAMYEVLYDSTGYGTVAGGNGNFYITNWGGHSGAQSAYNTYLSAVSSISVPENLASGNILRDSLYVSSGGTQSTPGAGQDFIYNLTPVPEPTTLIAGALLLVPFGASTIRFVRKSRNA